jgi:hypothetical protein
MYLSLGDRRWESAPTRAVRWLDPRRPWYACLQGLVEGPFSLRTLCLAMRSGLIRSHTFLWQEGLPRWARAGELPELGLLWEALPAPPILPDEAVTQVDLRLPELDG